MIKILENKFIRLESSSSDKIPPFSGNTLLSEVEIKNWKYTSSGFSFHRADTGQIPKIPARGQTAAGTYFEIRCPRV